MYPVTFKKPKTTEVGYDLLPAELVAACPDLKDPDGAGKPIFEARQRYEALDAERKKIIDELSRCTAPGAIGPEHKYDASQDAEYLIGGGDIETLTAPVQETHYCTLRRKLKAIERALPSIKNKPGQIQNDLTAEACGDLIPRCKRVVTDLLDAASNFYAALEMIQQLEQLLTKRGLRRDVRPPCMKLAAHEIDFLAKEGPYNLRRYIEQRAKAAGVENPLDGKEGE